MHQSTKSLLAFGFILSGVVNGLVDLAAGSTQGLTIGAVMALGGIAYLVLAGRRERRKVRRIGF